MRSATATATSPSSSTISTPSTRRFEAAGLAPRKIVEFNRDGALLARFFFVADPDGYQIEVLQRHGRYQLTRRRPRRRAEQASKKREETTTWAHLRDRRSDAPRAAVSAPRCASAPLIDPARASSPGATPPGRLETDGAEAGDDGDADRDGARHLSARPARRPVLRRGDEGPRRSREDRPQGAIEDGRRRARRGGAGGGLHRLCRVGWEADRVAILRGMEESAFFQKVRGGMVTGLYNQKELWPLFGYEGESLFQGRLHRARLQRHRRGSEGEGRTSWPHNLTSTTTASSSSSAPAPAAARSATSSPRRASRSSSLEAGRRLRVRGLRQRRVGELRPARLARHAHHLGRAGGSRGTFPTCRPGSSRRSAARRRTGPAPRCASRSTSSRR